MNPTLPSVTEANDSRFAVWGSLARCGKDRWAEVSYLIGQLSVRLPAIAKRSEARAGRVTIDSFTGLILTSADEAAAAAAATRAAVKQFD